MDLQATVVIDETFLSELVHEKTHAFTGRSYHLGEGPLIHMHLARRTAIPFDGGGKLKQEPS